MVEYVSLAVILFNTVFCGGAVYFLLKKNKQDSEDMRFFMEKAMSEVVKDKSALVKLVSACQDRIQAQTLADYSVLKASAEEPSQVFRDRSDQGEAEIADARLFTQRP